MNIEEIRELKRGDLVKDRVTGAVFEVYQVECYPDEINEERYVSIPLRVGLSYLPEGIEYIRTGSGDDEVFKMVGDRDCTTTTMESFRNSEVGYSTERILTCEDLEPTTMTKLLKSENVVSFKKEDLIELEESGELDESDESEIPDNLIFPVEQARENIEKVKALRAEILTISQMIKEASLQGKRGIKIPADLDRLEITTRFMRAGYNIHAGCIAW